MRLAEAAASRSAGPWVILGGLAAGLALGSLAGTRLAGQPLALADALGALWLDGLKMTIVPLVIALLVTGIFKASRAAQAGPMAMRTVLTFLVFLWASAISAALAMPALLGLWPLHESSAAALQASMPPLDTATTVPGLADFLGGLVPDNVFAAAAEGAVLPLTIFAVLFAFALLKIDPARRDLVASVFEGVGEALLVIISWVLKLAPLGVFALALGVGARAGGAALGALAHYVIIVSATGGLVLLAAYGVVVFGTRLGLARFAREVVPVQALAISTQSSLACLPAMLACSVRLGIREERADLVLPLAVALFRATGPAMNLAVALYVAHWFGITPAWPALLAGIAIAATTTLAAVSLPGQLSFISSIGPIAYALGVPIEPLALLIAVETLPDIMRTLGNVTMDVAVTGLIDEQTRED